jgi:hypothetical protein
MATPIYNAQGIARALTVEEQLLQDLDRARGAVRKWENVLEAIPATNARKRRWAQNRLRGAREARWKAHGALYAAGFAQPQPQEARA